MKYALALSGGGANFAFHVGAITGLHKSGIDFFDVVVGVSAGAVAGSNANQLQQLNRILDEIIDRPEKIYTPYFTGYDLKFDLLKSVKSIFKKKTGSLASNKPMFEFIRRFVNAYDIPPIFGVVVVSLGDGKSYLLTIDDFRDVHEFKQAILASTAQVPIWEPVESLQTKKGLIRFASDGGSRVVAPYFEALELIQNHSGDDEEWTLFVINCRGEESDSLISEPSNLIGYAIAADSIKQTEIFVNDLAYIQDHCINYKPDNINVVIIQPDQLLPSKIDFSYQAMTRSRELGENLAKTIALDTISDTESS